MKLIIAGSRNFNDYELLKQKLDAVFEKISKSNCEIVSGTARGADQLGERYAVENFIAVKKFPAEWDKYGKAAGYKRNVQMAEYGTHCICFWDGKSRGTKMMIDLAKSKGLKVLIVNY